MLLHGTREEQDPGVGGIDACDDIITRRLNPKHHGVLESRFSWDIFFCYRTIQISTNVYPTMHTCILCHQGKSSDEQSRTYTFIVNISRQSPFHFINLLCIMMTSSNGNIFRVTGPLCGEFTGHRWIPLTKASDAELWCFLWSAP